MVLWLAKHGVTTLAARKAVIVAGYLMMVSIVLLTRAETVLAYVVVFCCFTFGIGVFLGNQHAFKQDVVKKHVASGVNPARVKKLYLGLGHRDSPKAGGKGMIYIDDIRVIKSRAKP